MCAVFFPQTARRVKESRPTMDEIGPDLEACLGIGGIESEPALHFL